MKGLEPPRREAPDPKSGVATNYTTSAFFFKCLKEHLCFLIANIWQVFELAKYFFVFL
jgi:hypothetical protein